MKRISFLILFSLILAAVSSCQRVVPSKPNFSMQAPKGWFSVDKEGLNSNLRKFEFSEGDMNKLLEEQNANVLISAYYKYDPQVTPGIIPTIQINARPNKTRNFDTFRIAIIRSIEVFKQGLDEFKLIEEPKELEIAGTRSVFVHGTFVMKTPDGRKFNVRSRTYSVPQGNLFIQMNFTDSPEDEDCTAEFDELIKTISFK